MNALKKLKPIIVLSLICTLICSLLIVTHNLTYKDTSKELTEDLRAGCVIADGEGEYALVTDKAAAGLDSDEYKDIVKIVKNNTKNTFLFETVVDGYSADGIDAVIAIGTDGKVSGISIIALGETPGLGSKINDDAFLKRFVGAGSDITIVKTEPKNENEVQGVTGSTLSSKGMAKAVNLAVKAYSVMNKEVQAQ